MTPFARSWPTADIRTHLRDAKQICRRPGVRCVRAGDRDAAGPAPGGLAWTGPNASFQELQRDGGGRPYRRR
eukprot:11203490-Lingulodinium_polyedra.AAC.1